MPGSAVASLSRQLAQGQQPLHAGAARALDQQAVARRRDCSSQQRRRLFDGMRNNDRVPPAASKPSREPARILADGDQHVHAGGRQLLGRSAGAAPRCRGPVRPCAPRTASGAAAAGQRHQRARGAPPCCRDWRCSSRRARAARRSAAAPPRCGDGAGSRPARGAIASSSAPRARAARIAAARLAALCSPGQRHRPASGRRAPAQPAAVGSSPARQRPAMIAAVAPTRHHAAARPRRQAVEARAVGVQHRDAVGRQGVEQFALALDDAVERTELRQVRRRRVGDDADLRPGQRGQPRDVAHRRGPHLDDREAVARRQPEQRQRHAQAVVQVAGGRGDRAGAAPVPRAAKSLVVVLPLVPVTPTTVSAARRARQRSGQRRQRRVAGRC